MDMQKLIDSMNDMSNRDRARYHLTLGKLIKEAKALVDDGYGSLLVRTDDNTYLGNPHSYRGFYSDLAFEPSQTAMILNDFLHLLESKCFGQTFEGYKGGDYIMGEDTPLWVSNYGDADSYAIIDWTRLDNAFVLVTKHIDL